MAIHRKGCIYSEIQRNYKGREQRGRGSAGHFVKGVGFVASERRRWVGEICVHYKRYRFRSTSLISVQAWLREMIAKYSDLPFYEVSRAYSLTECDQLRKEGKQKKYSRVYGQNGL